MLTLTRRLNESIIIPELDIEVKVTKIRGKLVKISVIAPKEYTILRKELADGAAETNNDNR